MKPSEIIDFPFAMTEQNKNTIYSLAQEVPNGGNVLEIGSCMGGSSLCLGLGAPTAHITSYDIFVDRPNDPTPWGGRYGPRSVEANTERLAKHGVTNVKFIQSDSSTLESFNQPIDLLIVDGNHDYEYEHHDLFTHGPMAKVIYVHDYNWIPNPPDPLFPHGTPDVKRCVHEFLVAYPEFYVAHVGIQEIVLRRS